MYKNLRIICAIISALFLVVIVPAAVFFELTGFVICGFGAGLFFFFTLIFRKAQQNWEKKHGISDDPLEETFDSDDISGDDIPSKDIPDDTSADNTIEENTEK